MLDSSLIQVNLVIVLFPELLEQLLDFLALAWRVNAKTKRQNKNLRFVWGFCYEIDIATSCKFAIMNVNMEQFQKLAKNRVERLTSTLDCYILTV